MYAKDLLNQLINHGYKGCIILGGYDITASDDETLMEEFPGVQHYIKRYAEKPLADILRGKCRIAIVEGDPNKSDIGSPYAHGILKPAKKMYLETKRGCPYKCGFCEWGNAANHHFVFRSLDCIKKDLRFMQYNGVEEINVLDGTFNVGNNKEYSYIDVLHMMLSETTADITLQCRFELIPTKIGQEFIRLCHEKRSRIRLEFGIQTIHEEEMGAIGRKNNLARIDTAMNLLSNNEINYSVSIIYGIPHQNKQSFMKTISWIMKNKCENIAAYPLRIPKNSTLWGKKAELGIEEERNEDNVLSVIKTNACERIEHGEMSTVARFFQDYNPSENKYGPNDALFFIIISANNGVAEIEDITDISRLKLNTGFIKFSYLLLLSLQAQHPAGKKATIEELLPNLPDAVRKLDNYNKIDNLLLLTEDFWRTLSTIGLSGKDSEQLVYDLKKHDGFREFDVAILSYLFMPGAWTLEDTENKLIPLDFTVMGNKLIAVVKRPDLIDSLSVFSGK